MGCKLAVLEHAPQKRDALEQHRLVRRDVGGASVDTNLVDAPLEQTVVERRQRGEQKQGRYPAAVEGTQNARLGVERPLGGATRIQCCAPARRCPRNSRDEAGARRPQHIVLRHACAQANR
jgi:hypothetical protein